jgi:hypothetical protein
VVRSQNPVDAVRMSSVPAASNNNDYDRIFAVIQRAAADAAALSGRQQSSASNELKQPLTPVSQQTPGFNQVRLCSAHKRACFFCFHVAQQLLALTYAS